MVCRDGCLKYLYNKHNDVIFTRMYFKCISELTTKLYVFEIGAKEISGTKNDSFAHRHVLSLCGDTIFLHSHTQTHTYIHTFTCIRTYTYYTNINAYILYTHTNTYILWNLILIITIIMIKYVQTFNETKCNI